MRKPVLDDQEEQLAWVEYKKTKSVELRDSIIRKYMPLAKYVAGKISIGMPPSVGFEDLVQCGLIGLFDAVEKYEPDKNVKFKTYATTRIRGAIIDELRAQDWVPRSVRQKAREVEDAIAITESRLGRAATDEEVAEYLKVSVDEYRDVLYKVSCTSILSLNDMWYNGDDNDKISLMDTIEAPSSLNPDEITNREEAKRILTVAISELSEKERMVLAFYYYDDMTLKEIGKALNVSESRVSQLHSGAILRLRARLRHPRKGII